ncbi:hypothetical protein V7138_17300 [Bacillus sp. JJ1533]|uniref:hypothetical protein n=1 Tax=Bacillus sp. JJ1533 TaxID=3122959 RepID=UPI002FFE2F0C
MKHSNYEVTLEDKEHAKKEKPKKTIHQILRKLQSQGVNATLCKKRSKLSLGL